MPPPIDSMNRDPSIAHQFEDAAQQREAATLGMWIFLSTEILFFGGMFLGYTNYRLHHPEAFRLASQHTLLLFGGTNTALLLMSSFTIVLAVRSSELAQPKIAACWLAVTAGCGVLFLALKSIEYTHEIHEGLLPTANFHLEGVESAPAKMFFYIYFLMTGVHALHVLIGIVAISIFAIRLRSGRRDLATAVDLLGLYWHFVDIVWVFLFPLIYLIGRR